MGELASDFGTFLLAIKRHWVALVTSSIFAASGAIYEHSQKPIPIEIVWGAAIAFLVFACFLAWRDEHKQVLGREKKKTIREEIARFQQIGTTLQVDCETNILISDQDIYNRFAQYDQGAQAWFKSNLDSSYATRFSDPTGLNLPVPHLPSQRRTNVWGYVANRQARLREFIIEYLN